MSQLSSLSLCLPSVSLRAQATDLRLRGDDQAFSRQNKKLNCRVQFRNPTYVEKQDPLQSPVRFAAGASFPLGKPINIHYRKMHKTSNNHLLSKNKVVKTPGSISEPGLQKKGRSPYPAYPSVSRRAQVAGTGGRLAPSR